MLKASVVQVHFLDILLSLGWSSVDDHDIGNLFELNEERVAVRIDEVYMAVTHQVAVPFVSLIAKEPRDKLIVRLLHTLVRARRREFVKLL